MPPYYEDYDNYDDIPCASESEVCALVLLSRPNVDVNCRNRYGRTALHVALRERCSPRLVGALLTFHEIDLDACSDNLTAVDLARESRLVLFSALHN